MTTRAHGVDVSKWNGSFSLPAPPPLPVDFVIQRVSYGGMADEKLEVLHAQIQCIALRGAYHYFSSALSWQSQADIFLRLAGRSGGYHFFALDLERDFNKRSAGFASGARQWIERVGQESGKRVLLYTNPAVYQDWLLPFGGWMEEHPLWVAQYWWLPSPEKSPGMKSMKRADWTFYQYTRRGNGRAYGSGSDHIDLNVFNGTADDLRSWLDVDPQIDKPPVEDQYLDGYRQALSDAGQAVENLRPGGKSYV
ncbi:MAG: glycoside hydrolase family 25 protein [Anaerolineae bacterium]|nr:glycoside hydrolase family 25 protein [Anaerolineae bacterium]